MSFDREKVKADLKEVILNYLKDRGIEPHDSTKVIMNADGIWKALCVSGKMPRVLTYGMFMEGMTGAALTQEFGNIFGGRR